MHPVFDAFCRMTARLHNQERELVLKLAEDFLWKTLGDYGFLCSSALSKVDMPTWNNASRIFFVPLVHPKDLDKGKSGLELPRIAKLHAVPSIQGLQTAVQNRTLHCLESMEALARRWGERNGALIVFFDDFMGTGESALSAIEHYRTEVAVESDTVIVVVLVGMEAGVYDVSHKACSVYTARTVQKGISDNPSLDSTDKQAASEIMREIEQRIRVSRKHLFGYGSSEALVALENTPNNTFPVFWTTTEVGGHSWPAPFPRAR